MPINVYKYTIRAKTNDSPMSVPLKSFNDENKAKAKMLIYKKRATKRNVKGVILHIDKKQIKTMYRIYVPIEKIK